jgi:(heptosyl)LPS beta-1,4-glucosyltransferase
VCNQITIFDIGIDAQTLEKIREEFPRVTVVRLEKPEYVELIRQKTFDMIDAEWILLLDPDEYLSPELVNVINEFDLTQYSHLKFPRQNYIFGKWIAHSRWWPDYQVRLFRRDSIYWPSTLHAQPEIQGKGFIVGAFEDRKMEMNACAIVHHNYANVTQYLEKAVRYAKVEAQQLTADKKTFTLLDATKRATSEFVSRFFAEKGYRDGAHGFILAVLQMFYYFIVFVFAWERDGYQEATLHTTLKSTEELFVKTSKQIYHWSVRERLARGARGVAARIKSKIL